MTEKMRIQRALARSGIASRRHAEDLIRAGRVKVNGTVAEIGQSVDPERDDIRVDGKRVAAPAGPVWMVLHKPSGVMITRTDAAGRRTVFDLVKPVPGLTYVGRLDYLTEGVMILTTDGDGAHALTHPSNEVERTYLAHVRGDVDTAARRARGVVQLEDGPVRARHVAWQPLGGGLHEFEVTIAEGRNREVRRFCEALGLRVERLIRTRYGPVELGRLKPGESRPLTRAELARIASIVKGVGQPRTDRRS
jgi:23S rRNA pseudouridine2605 synthase